MMMNFCILLLFCCFLQPVNASKSIYECHKDVVEGRGGACNDYMQERICTRELKLPKSNSTHIYFGTSFSMSTADSERQVSRIFSMLCGLEQAEEFAPGIQFHPVFADDKGNQNGGFEAGLCLKEVGVPFVFGPFFSSPASGLATVGKVFDLPILGISSSSPELSKNDTMNGYPTFSRMVVSDAFQGKGLAHLCRFYKWRYVSTIHLLGDIWAEGIYNVFANEISNTGVKISVSGRVNSKDATGIEVRDSLIRIKKSGVRVILLVLFQEQALEILKVAKELGMVGTGWMYIAVDGWIDAAPQFENNLGVGVIGLSPYFDFYSKQYKRLAECISNHKNDETGAFGNLSWINPQPYQYDILSYDGAIVMMKLFKQLVDEGADLFDHQNLIRKLRSIYFYGGSGHINFDNSGERIGVPYKIINVLPDGKTQEIGRMETDGNFSIVKSQYFDETIYGSDGSKDVPLDLFVECTVSVTAPVEEESFSYTLGIENECSAGKRRVEYMRIGEFSKQYCSEKLPFLVPCDYPDSAPVAMFAAVFTLMVQFGYTLLIAIHWDDRYMKRGQRVYLLCLTLGSTLVLVPTFISIGSPPTDFSCMAMPIFLSFGITIIFGTLVLKMWKIQCLLFYRSKPKRRTPGQQTLFELGRLGLICLIDVILLTVLVLHSPPHVKTRELEIQPGELITERFCTTSDADVMTGIIMFFHVLLALGCCIVSFNLRNVKSDISESQHIFAATYNTTVCAIVAIAVQLGLGLDAINQFSISSVATSFGSFVVTSLLLVPKFRGIFYKIEPTIETNTMMISGAGMSTNAFPVECEQSSVYTSNAAQTYGGLKS